MRFSFFERVQHICGMAAKILFMVIVTTVLPGQLQAGIIDPGIWQQHSSTLDQCNTCTLTITEKIPNMLEIKASQGWLGYVYYVPIKDEYHGFFELEKDVTPPGKNWRKTLFTLKMIRDDKTVQIQADSRYVRFQATYRFLKALEALPPEPVPQPEEPPADQAEQAKPPVSTMENAP